LLSLTQPTEAGTLYSATELKALSSLAHKHGLLVHMDGARLTNALVALDTNASSCTWESGVDILSFGTTKGGTMAAEAVVVFDPPSSLGGGRTNVEQAVVEMRRRRKRAGHELSKMRFVSAQVNAFLASGLWRTSAERANSTATDLARRLEAAAAAKDGCDVFSWQHPVETNQLFLSLPCTPQGDTLVLSLSTVGGTAWDSEAEGRQCVRMVTAFDTTEEELSAAVVAFQAGL
jgi:threonine aldolase